MAAVFAAANYGLKTIIAVDLVQSRLDLALTLGATAIVNARSEDAVKRIQELTGGAGMYCGVEATGTPPSALFWQIAHLQKPFHPR